MVFDGKQIRDEILKELADKVVSMENKPTLAEFLIGDDPVSAAYAELKHKIALKIGVQFCLYKFSDKDSEEEIVQAIEFLNDDPETDGIMIQIPVPKGFNREKLIGAISPAKDVDGLRYCQGLDSDFKPPVVEAILEAVKRSLENTKYEIRNTKQISNSNFQKLKQQKIALIGHGFLVGKPLEKALKELGVENLTVVTSENILDSKFEILDSDLVISATGKAGIIKPDMVKEGVVLIDAGTAEENGELKGDIDPETYDKSSYYTPVPGGIGPVTVAMLFKNLVSK